MVAIEQIFETSDAPALMDVLREEGWNGELLELVAWVWLADLPNKPFFFRGKEIVDVKRFYSKIGGAINDGPDGSRARSGQLAALLKELRVIAGGC